MVCLSDLPLEIIREIVDNLQDDLPALKAGAQTCLSLLLLCREHIFRTITLCPYYQQSIRSFASLLDSNPQIADYVRNLVYSQLSDLQHLDCHVSQILDKFHRIQSFHFEGGDLIWSELDPRLRESISRIIHSVTRLNIQWVQDFPISIFIPCINLVELKLKLFDCMVDDINSYEHEYCTPDVVPQLQSLTLNGHFATRFRRSDTLTTLVNARRSEHVPVLDFSNLRILTFYIYHDPDRVALHALIKVIKKLETLSCKYYAGMYPIYLHFIN